MVDSRSRSRNLLLFASQTMRFTSKSKASASTLRLSLQGVVAFLFVASILITIPALILVRTLTNSPEEEHHHHIRANDAIDAPKSNGHSNNIPRKEEVVQSHAYENWHLLNTKEEDNRGVEKANDIVPNPNVLSQPNPKQFKSYPGLTEDQSVSCGAHKSRSCDQCPQGNGASWCNDHCEWRDEQCVRSSKVKNLHPDYFRITQRYAFSPVQNQNQQYVNIIMVRSPFREKDDEDVYQFYRDDILFLGISSFEDFPLTPTNPYSAKYDGEYYLNMFPGFLHMVCITSGESSLEINFVPHLNFSSYPSFCHRCVIPTNTFLRRWKHYSCLSQIFSWTSRRSLGKSMLMTRRSMTLCITLV